MGDEKTLVAVLNGKLFKLECDFSVEPLEGSFDFGNERENEEYLAKFKSGYLSSYDVAVLEYCPKSKNWILEETLSSIHAVGPMAAIEVFFETLLTETREQWVEV